MKEFFIENWKLLLFVVFAIAELLIVIFKPRVKVQTTEKLTEILAYLPVLINHAEDFVNKPQKKEFVIKTIKDLLKLDDSYDSFISESLEYILSTPQKKGIIKDEK